MALNFNSFNSHSFFASNCSHSRLNFGLSDDAMSDLQFLLSNNNSSSGQIHVNGNGSLMTSSQLFIANNFNDPVNQNEPMMISQRSQPDTKYAHGQLGVRQRIVDAMRRSSTYPAPRRVHVHSVIDYSPLQNQPGVNEVTVTEIVKTQFLTSTSTRDHQLLAPNDHHFNIFDAQELSFHGRNSLMSNQLNQPAELLNGSQNNESNLSNSLSMNHPLNQSDHQPLNFHNIYHQNSLQNQSNATQRKSAVVNSSQMNHHPFTENIESFQNANYHKKNYTQNQSKPASFSDHADHHHSAFKSDEILDPVPMSCVFVAENPSDENSSIQNQKNPNQQQLVPSSQMIMKVPNDQTCIGISDDEDEDRNNDGKTHSLPRCKNGPYVCPKCNEVFQTSQFFASHVSSAHYRYETIAERKRRLAAKFKNKKNFQVVELNDGITILPADKHSIKKPGRPRKKVKRAAKTEPIEVQKQEENMIPTIVAVEDFLVDVVIKEEYK